MSAERTFEELPRILWCKDDTRAVMFFHTCDNPYGSPANVYDLMKHDPAWFIRERFYGKAHREISQAFPKFSDAHIVSPEFCRELTGTLYQFVDPCSGRNWAMAWVLLTEDKCAYWIREWPSQVEELPGYGFVGPWAEPGSGKKGERDGRRGPGQIDLGLSLTDYKKEIARVEGWREYRDWMNGKYADDPRGEPELVASWPEWVERQTAGKRMRKEDGEAPEAPRRWQVHERYMDSRFGNTPIHTDDAVTTLIEEMADLGLTFLPTSAGEQRRSIAEGLGMINSALGYNVDKKVDYTNRPREYFSSDCVNMIFAMRNFTGADGQHGATKDFVDLVRYRHLKGVQWVGAADWEATGGGTW